MQSNPLAEPLHVAIIMDGNGRWATQRGLPRPAGHRRGADAVRRVVGASPDLGIGTLTLYAFSADNWKRPPAEVENLMRLFEEFLNSRRRELVKNSVRLQVLGRRDRLRPKIVRAIERTERATKRGKRLNLRLAVDYSSRHTIATALRGSNCAAGSDAQRVTTEIARACHATSIVDVDLLIRSGGERRLSDFLLWECAYAELHFTRRLWPDFTADDLARAVREFQRRERRFGGVRNVA